MNKIAGDATIGRYLKKIGSIPLLTQKETAELVEKVKKGDDKEAKERLVNSNLRLVVYIAKKYVGWCSLTFWDLIQEGNCGLLQAVKEKKFDSEKGCQFSSYAGQAIRNAIISAMYERSRMIRIPASVQLRIRKIFQVENYLMQEKGGQISIKILADKINKIAGFKKSWVKKDLSYCYEFISLQQPIGFDGETNLGEFIDEGGNVARFLRNSKSGFNPEIYRKLNDEGLRGIFNNALKIFPPKERLIIKLRFGLNGQGRWTLEKIGKKFGVTRERVRQIEAKALDRLRKSPQIKYLEKQ